MLKLKTFTKLNSSKAILIAPCISFSKIGTIRFNQSAIQLLGIKAGDKVCLHQDESRPKDWYISKSDINGFDLRKASNDATLLFNSSVLVKVFKSSIGSESPSRFKIAQEPTEQENVIYYAILTSAK